MFVVWGLKILQSIDLVSCSEWEAVGSIDASFPLVFLAFYPLQMGTAVGSVELNVNVMVQEVKDFMV
jgi:hypothetical protein